MINVRCELKTKEADTGVFEGASVLVLSHWNRSELVVLELDGHRFVLSARELTQAIENATRTVRHA